MQSRDWRSEYPTLVKILQERLGDKRTCIEIVNGYEEVMSSLWAFTAQFLGDAGTNAILTWSLRLATRGNPLLDNVEVGEHEIDFGILRARATESDCNMCEVQDAMLGFAVTTFETLADLTGKSLTERLLGHLTRTDGNEDQ